MNEYAYIAVISHLRPENVRAIETLTGLPVHWYVGVGERGDYLAAGATNVHEGGGLCESRNAALKDAWALKLPCVQISDDLKKLEYTNDGKSKRPISFQDAVLNIVANLYKTPYRMAGVAPTPNAFYFHKPFSERQFIVGDFIVVKQCSLFFDEKLKLKEDYDYTAQHIKRYAGALRVNGILATFEHRTNKGGAVAARTSELEKESIAYLMQKHPGFFRMNPRRTDEILMK